MPLSLSLYTAGNTCCMGVCPIVSCRGCSLVPHTGWRTSKRRTFWSYVRLDTRDFFDGSARSILRFVLGIHYAEIIPSPTLVEPVFQYFVHRWFHLENSLWEGTMFLFFTFLFYIVINDAKIFNFLASLLREIFFSFISFEDSFALLIFRSFQNHWTKF